VYFGSDLIAFTSIDFVFGGISTVKFDGKLEWGGAMNWFFVDLKL
jgi:hypothetical protein